MTKQTLKSYGMNTARFFKSVWSLFNIMQVKVNLSFNLCGLFKVLQKKQFSRTP